MKKKIESMKSKKMEIWITWNLLIGNSSTDLITWTIWILEVKIALIVLKIKWNFFEPIFTIYTKNFKTFTYFYIVLVIFYHLN